MDQSELAKFAREGAGAGRLLLGGDFRVGIGTFRVGIVQVRLLQRRGGSGHLELKLRLELGRREREREEGRKGVVDKDSLKEESESAEATFEWERVETR